MGARDPVERQDLPRLGTSFDVTNLGSPEAGVSCSVLAENRKRQREKGLRDLHGHPSDVHECRSVQTGIRSAAGTSTSPKKLDCPERHPTHSPRSYLGAGGKIKAHVQNLKCTARGHVRCLQQQNGRHPLFRSGQRQIRNPDLRNEPLTGSVTGTTPGRLQRKSHDSRQLFLLSTRRPVPLHRSLDRLRGTARKTIPRSGSTLCSRRRHRKSNRPNLL